MIDLIKSATSVSTPIGLAGLFGIVIFLIMRQIIKKNIFPSLTREHSVEIFKLILNKFFILSLASIIFGFFGFSIEQYYKTNNKTKEGNDVPIGTYPGEKWEKATADQMRLFEDKWCAPRLRGFTSTFKIENNHLYRQIFTGPPENQTTKWLPIEAYISNRGTFKLDYIDNDRPSVFVNFEGREHAAFYINERIINDDGTIKPTDKILTLSCNRCRLEQNGAVYYCKGDEGY